MLQLKEILEIINRDSVIKIIKGEAIILFGINSAIPFEFMIDYGLARVKSICTDNKSNIIIFVE